MKRTIIADSCCDVNPILQQYLDIQLVPLNLNVNGTFLEDNATINIESLLEKMKLSSVPVGSSCPSPEHFAEKMRLSDQSFVITLSSKLSGSYTSATIARDIVLEEFPDKEIHVFDSKSAAAGELLIALHIKALISKDTSFSTIVKTIDNLISKSHTLFVLEDLSNLVKNGRISKTSGLLGGMLALRPIMSDDGNGEIICIKKLRGTKAAMNYLTEHISKDLADNKNGSTLVTLSHCNCLARAEELKKSLMKASPAIKNVIIVNTSGISTVYASDGGVILSY